MPFRLQLCGPADLQGIAEIRVKALANDGVWKAMKGSITYEEDLELNTQILATILGPGIELGCSQTWKAVDENGKMVAFAGVDIPKKLSESERLRLKTHVEDPPGCNVAIMNWFRDVIGVSVVKHGYDPEKHILRRNTMVLPENQRMGLGRILTDKINSIADEKGAAVYARARPNAAALFRKMGYVDVERIDVDFAKYGGEGKETAYVLIRQPGAKN